MTEFHKSERNRIKRLPKRGKYDKETIYKIIDEALICHVGFGQDNQPFVIPTIHARMNDSIIIHGSKKSRMLKHIEAGHPLCITITLLDGIVFARSVFHHSMNYRSVVLFGKGSIIESDDEKTEALKILTEHIARGRWEDARMPNRKELNASTVISVPIESASAKIRTGPPSDDKEDYQLPIWAGVLPIQQQALAPVNDPLMSKKLPIPKYILNYERDK